MSRLLLLLFLFFVAATRALDPVLTRYAPGNATVGAGATEYLVRVDRTLTPEEAPAFAALVAPNCPLRAAGHTRVRTYLLVVCPAGAAAVPAASATFAGTTVRAERNVHYTNQTLRSQTGATVPWSLDRIDVRGLTLNSVFRYNATGAGVTIYVVDTGVNTAHTEFDRGRATFGVNYISDGINTDCAGHGTHVASLTAGKTFGAAKDALVRAVKVLSCQGGSEGLSVVLGLEYVLAQCEADPDADVVVNMSFGGGASPLFDAAVADVRAACHVAFVGAAGNSNSGACDTAPSVTPGVLIVGASTRDDERAYFSNYGACVDTFAPGLNVPGAWYLGGSLPFSGTSMASPIAAGVVAIAFEQNRLQAAGVSAAIAGSRGDAAIARVLAEATPATIGSYSLVYSMHGAHAPAVGCVDALLLLTLLWALGLF